MKYRFLCWRHQTSAIICRKSLRCTIDYPNSLLRFENQLLDYEVPECNSSCSQRWLIPDEAYSSYADASHSPNFSFLTQEGPRSRLSPTSMMTTRYHHVCRWVYQTRSSHLRKSVWYSQRAFSMHWVSFGGSFYVSVPENRMDAKPLITSPQ